MKKIVYSTILIAVCAVIYYSCENREDKRIKRVVDCGYRHKKPQNPLENNAIQNTDSISKVLICPKCKSDNTADIKYGLWARGGDAVADSLKKANGGRPVVPGGCVGKPYNHYCFNCMYQW